jgi:hypothetical protein
MIEIDELNLIKTKLQATNQTLKIKQVIFNRRGKVGKYGLLVEKPIKSREAQYLYLKKGVEADCPE